MGEKLTIWSEKALADYNSKLRNRNPPFFGVIIGNFVDNDPKKGWGPVPPSLE